MKNLDEQASSLTKRERACIDLRVPESGDKELDALITEANRNEMTLTIAQARVAAGYAADAAFTFAANSLENF